MSVLLCNPGLLVMGGLISMSAQEPSSHTHKPTGTTSMASTGRGSVVLLVLSTSQKTASKTSNLSESATATVRSMTALLVLSTTKETPGKIGNLAKSATRSVTLLILPTAT